MIKRIAIIWIGEALALGILARLMDSITIEHFRSALGFIAILTFLNAFLWPAIVRYTVAISIFTFGIFTLIMNVALIMLTTYISLGVQVQGFTAALTIAFTLTLVNMLLTSIFSLDDDYYFKKRVIKRKKKGGEVIEDTDKPGILFLEIDGLSEKVLKKAMEDGNLPTLKRWLEEGSHILKGWECDLSSQTGASQAGILHGSNVNMPAFRWYEKDISRIMVSNHPDDAAEIEKRHSNGNGLLAENGASRGNLLSGDAPNVMFTFSTMMNKERFQSQDFHYYFTSPYNLIRTLILSIWDIILEKKAAWGQSLRNELPRVHRGGVYPFLRVAMTVILRDITVDTLIGDMLSGVPVAYSTFVGYDEVAHHSGIMRYDAMSVLKKLDKRIARLEDASKQAPRPYHLVVLSDHGQSQGATFLQRAGYSLEELVQKLATDKYTMMASTDSNESWGNISAALTGSIQSDDLTSKAIKKAVSGHTHDGNVILGPTEKEYLEEKKADKKGDKEEKDIIVMASGNLGLIYFTKWKNRMTLEEINENFPNMIERLSQHDGIGFLLMDSKAHGAVVVGPEGVNFLEEDRFEGVDPLKDFGKNAKRHLLRTHSYCNVADIMVGSLFNPETEEVAAFEELVGCHGGLGGPQSHPFILFPSELSFPDEEVIGAENIHKVIKGWVSSLNQ